MRSRTSLFAGMSVAGALLASSLAPGGAAAAAEAPQPLPLPPEIAAPRDVDYPGTIRLVVDATDTERHIFSVHETIPVAGAGPMVLLYPAWLPGNHAPRGRADKIGGLTIYGDGQRLEWHRDPVNVYAFHTDVPEGVQELVATFQFLSPVNANEGRVVMTQEMLNLQWNTVALYPAGHFTRRITVEASVQLPDGWQFGTALETASSSDGMTTFKPVSFENLVDSPMFAGRYFKRVELDGGERPVFLDMFADAPELLDASAEQIRPHRALVRQADLLFRSRHFDHYDFLLALTDRMSGIGLEHHQSSENTVVPAYFSAWDRNAPARDLLPHEYVHSWNGKFRRPADLWTPNFNVPMRNSLLWLYEGQTQYWGYVLSARSGLWSQQQALEALAMTAAAFDHRPGRAWRTLGDTTNDPITAERRPMPWRSWQRSEDYYSEGLLVWLDADTLIRERSRNRRSLDDFARAFFGIGNGSYVPVTYTFEDVVEALNGVQPYDWAAFLTERLEAHAESAPLDGIDRGGYRLAYTETPTDFFKDSEAGRRVTDLNYSLGLVVNREGRLIDVRWEGPAYEQGLNIGTQIVAVNGMAFDGDRLKAAVTAAKGGAPVELIVRNGDRFRAVVIDYAGGLRYPRLEKESSSPRLDQIFAARR